eukprot:CAMPEP_0184390446 /NCGR_PEP_ID=MMETSP0007-20130409/13316_1 /TAXON_ID=97485 /ORGANISM="Prymnesium parvum, Strain Texoma1" /LENGTH=78 /DNA_ID=CAMNT_0026740191 /DNA_START=464 /DNA_END=700 /DNA_ORIENTATION=-
MTQKLKAEHAMARAFAQLLKMALVCLVLHEDSCFACSHLGGHPCDAYRWRMIQQRHPLFCSDLPLDAVQKDFPWSATP